MAETPRKDDTRSLADRLVPDPKNPPDLTMLQGWLGASSEERHRRLYLDPELSRSLEIPDDAIVHTQDMPADVSPLGGSWVWIKADAAIKQGPGLERLYARFLRGQIQQDFLAGGGAGVGAGTVGAPGGGVATSPLICPPQTIFNCPTRTAWCRPSVFTICPSQLTICPTRQVICQVTAPVQCAPSLSFQCPTQICPSVVDACPSAPGGCWDPTIVQGTFVQQPGLGQVGLQGGLGFDPGAMAGGFVGAPGAGGGAGQQIGVPATQFFVCQPTIILQTCHTRTPQLCITRTVNFCRSVFTPWCPPTIPHVQCPCPTLIASCPTVGIACTVPPLCPIVTQPPGCPVPTLPGGCPSGFVCGDPGGATTVINPGLQAGPGFDPSGGLGFGQAGGGLVGAAAFATGWPACRTRVFPQCDPVTHMPHLCWM